MSEIPMLAARVTFGANVAVAGLVGTVTLWFPSLARRTVFSGVVDPSVGLQIVGSMWVAIALVSLAGVFHPRPLLAVLVIQLLYKALWLVAVVGPALVAGRMDTIPSEVALFFAVWVAMLPFVIPWSELARG